MDRPDYSQDQIIDLLREAQLRLAHGESLASVCKSLGISQSSYRRWRIRYGERAKENLAGVANGSTEQSAGVRPSSTENLTLAKGPKASLDGSTPELSKEAEKLLDAANGTSDPARNAWLAFLALLTYLLVTLGSVSHKDLLLDSPVKLPIVNVDIPLFGFFQIAPVLLLLVYLSLLVQHVILARKYRQFTEAIAPYEKETGKQHPARELVHSYVVSQILAGPKPNPIRSGLMRLMVFVTFTLLPLATLLYFQIKFLPYHEVWITYWHRIAVLIALAMLLGVLPLIYPWARKREITIGPQEEPWHASPIWISCGALLALLVLVFSWLIATVPNERVDRAIGFVPPTITPEREAYEVKLLNPLVRFIYERIPVSLRWLLSYRVLVVEDTDLVPDEGDKQDEVSRVLRDRDFRFALLSRSDLHRADLTGADLRGAQMFKTRLDKAKLEAAQLQGAFLVWVKLQDAYLQFAQLQDANLQLAQLQGADLSEAQLQGADLSEAQLQGANLSHAQLQGAHLGSAELQGAILWVAQLQGANLSNAQLQGAFLLGAQLQGADLSEAQLQGAHLGEFYWPPHPTTQLQGTVLRGADIWLVNFPPDLANQSPVPLGLADLKMSPPSAEAKARLRDDLQANIADGKSLEKGLDPILRDDPPNWGDKESWNQYVSKAKEEEPSPDKLAKFYAELACDDTEGYIANSMARRVEVYSEDDGRRRYAKPLAIALLKENCIGAKALTDEMRAALKNLVSAPE